MVRRKNRAGSGENRPPTSHAAPNPGSSGPAGGQTRTVTAPDQPSSSARAPPYVTAVSQHTIAASGTSTAGSSGESSSSHAASSSSAAELAGEMKNLTLLPPVQSPAAPPSSSKALKVPRRPGFGTSGQRCVVRANHFLVQVADKSYYHYDVSITPEVTSKGVNRAIIKELVKLYKLSHLGNRMPAYDGKKSLYTAGPLPFDSKEFKIILADKNNDTSDGSSSRRKGRERQFKVTIRYAAKGDLDHLQRFIEGRQLDCPHEIIQVLDVVLRTIPSAEYTVVGRSFFSTKFGKGDLGDGLVYWKGYYQSLPATQQGLSLNIDLSATAFYDEIDVIDFISMSLNFRHFSRPLPDNLVDRLMGYSRTRDMDSEELLEQLPSLQNLLYRLMGCQPEGAAVGNFFIQYALALVALKTLKVIHRALLEGDPTFTEELLNYSQQGRILQLSNFKDDSSPIAWDCSAWVRTYALFLEEILECFKIAKYDIEAERLPRPAQGQEKGYSRTRDMDSEEPLEHLPSLQNLLYRLMGCQPEGAAVGNFFIQYALALVLKEIFKMNCAFNDGIINLSDKFFEMPRHEAVKALDVYKRAGQQGLNDDVVDPFSLEEKNALALAIVPSESDGGASHMAFNDSTGWELALVTARSSNTSSITDRKLPLYIRSGREPTVFEPPVGLGNRTKTARVIHSGQYSCRDEDELNISTETKEKKSLLERLSEKRVLLLGGEGFEDGAAGDFGKYHPLTDGIDELPGMTIPRSQAAAALLDDRIYFYGGVSPGTVHLDSHLNSVESYDLATNAWGGIETPNHQEYYTDAEFLDVNLGAWVQFPDDMILARLGHAAVQLGGALYISGGSNWDLYFSVVETYDPRQPHWRPLSVMHSQRSNHSSVVFQDKIYAIGGTNHDGTLDTVEVYDPRMDVWEVDEFQMNVARESATSAVIGGSIYMIGGCSFDEEEEMDIADSVEVYRPGEGWTMLHDPSIVNTYAMASLVVPDDLVRPN